MSEFDHYFYSVASNTDSYIPYRNSFSVAPIIEFSPVSLSLNYAYYFGDQTAHRFMPGLSVTLKKNKLWKLDRIAITPSFFVLYGNETITSMEIQWPQSALERLSNLRKYGTRYKVVLIDKNVFGIMNYAISVPLNITYKKWGLSFTYTYNVPKALPGEPFTLSKSTYLSGSILYYLSFRRDKKTL